MSSNANNQDGSKRFVSDVSAKIQEATRINQTRIEQEKKRKQAEAEEVRKREERKTKAIEAVAADAVRTKKQLEEIIDNQKKSIEILEDQLNASKSQLQVLRNLFASSQDGVSVEKELTRHIQAQIDETHPLWDYVKDKGADIAIAGAPVFYNAFRAYLMSKGIVLP